MAHQETTPERMEASYPIATRRFIRETFSSHQLGSKYRPRSTPGREEELRKLRFRLQDALNYGCTGCTLLYGPSGAGKTLLGRNALHEVTEAAEYHGKPDIYCIYLDLSKMTTMNQVWAHIITHISEIKGVEARVKRGTSDSEYAARLKTLLKGGTAQFILVLDELDKHLDRNSLFRWFTRFDADNILWATIVISNDPLFRSKLAPEIQSSLGNPYPIEFKAYTQPALVGILQERVNIVCKPEAVDPAVVHVISQGEARTHGDARNALDLLKTTVEHAEADATAERVEIRHCIEAESQEDNKFMESVVLGLPLHKRFVLAVVVSLSARGAQNGQARWVSTKDAYKHYVDYLEEHQFTEPLKLRQFNNLLGFLTKQQNLLEAMESNRGSIGGNTKVYRPTSDVPSEFMPRVLATDPYIQAMFQGIHIGA